MGELASPQAMTERVYAPSELSPSAGRAAVCSAGTSAAARGTPLYTSVCSNTSAQTGAENVGWKIGDKVEHKAFGLGTVVKVNGSGENAELDVAFSGNGIKRLLAAFAPIRKV